MDAPEIGRGPGSRPQGRGTSGRVAGRTRAVVALEPLEGRALLSGMIADMATLPALAAVGPMAVSRDGNLWTAEAGRPGGPALAEVKYSGAKSEVVLPSSDAGYHVTAVATDDSGNVWYTLAADETPKLAPAGKVGRVGTGRAVTEFPLGDPKDTPIAAVNRPGGGLYVAVTGARGGPAIETVDASGAVTATVPVSGAKNLSWLTVGSDNTLWFVDGDRIGNVSPQGVVHEFALPAPADGSAVDLSNAQLTAGDAGSVWFLGLGGVNRIDPAGKVVTTPMPGARPTSLTRATDNNVWISFVPTDVKPWSSTPGAALARLTGDGQASMVPDRVDAAGSAVTRMASGHDASLWLGETGGKVARVSLAGIPAISIPVIAPVNRGALKTDAAKKLDGRVVTFQPNDPQVAPGNYTATIDWGDGNVTPGTVKPGDGGTYDVFGTHTYTAAAGTAENATVTVRAANGASAQVFNLIRVVDSAADIPWQAYSAGASWTKYGATTPGTPSPAGSVGGAVQHAPTPRATPPADVKTPATGATSTPTPTPAAPPASKPHEKIVFHVESRMVPYVPIPGNNHASSKHAHPRPPAHPRTHAAQAARLAARTRSGKP